MGEFSPPPPFFLSPLLSLYSNIEIIFYYIITKIHPPFQNPGSAPAFLTLTQYKIVTKTIADRISKVLPKLIQEDQTGYVKGRYIGQNIRLVKDIMKITALENIPGMAIFIDFKKAFDSVDWNFLAKVLEAFNFGPQIRKWIKTFYTDISSCVRGQTRLPSIRYPLCSLRGNFSTGNQK